MTGSAPNALLRCVLAPLLLLCPLLAQAKLNVVATLPDLGSLAHEIGKDKIDLVVFGKPDDDPHFVQPRPNFVEALRNADVLIEADAELEVGWLPPLVQKAGNAKLEIGKPGRVEASEGIHLLNMAAKAASGVNDEHLDGNPHFMVDPVIARSVAQRIAKAFMTADPANAAFYDANYKKLETAINRALQYWRGALQLLEDKHVAAYHDSWPYFAHRFGLKIDTFLEPSPGVPPSALHLRDVIQKMKQDQIKALVVEPYQDRRIVDIVAHATGAKVIEVAQFPGGIPGTDSYMTLMSQLVKRMAEGIK